MGPLSGVRARKTPAPVFVALAAAVLSASLLAGCGSKPVATVNGVSLSEQEFHKLTEGAINVTPQAGTVGMQVLSQWIGNTLLAQEAKRQNVYPSDAELTARIDAIRKRTAFQGGDLEQQLQQQGRSFADFKQEILNDMIRENVMFRGVEVSEAEIQKAFEQGKSQFGMPEAVRLSQITVDSPAKLKEARNDLAGNADFALVAQSHSKDPFAQAGGKVPQPVPRQVPPGGPVDPRVVETAYKLKEGQVSEPVQVGANWVIVRLDEKIPAKTPSLDEVKELVRPGLRQQKAMTGQQFQQNRQAFVEALQKADIKINRPEYQIVAQQFAAGPPGGAAGPGGAPMPGGGG